MYSNQLDQNLTFLIADSQAVGYTLTTSELMQPQPDEDDDWFYSGMDSVTPSTPQCPDVLLSPRHSAKIVYPSDQFGFPASLAGTNFLMISCCGLL